MLRCRQCANVTPGASALADVRLTPASAASGPDACERSELPQPARPQQAPLGRHRKFAVCRYSEKTKGINNLVAKLSVGP